MKRASRAEISGPLFDLVVVGGGITGVATARDAALRGLSVALIEKDDFAAGTSSRSSKLIHGGLRYLESYQFRLVAESLRERERFLKIAPHLTEVRPFLYLLYDGYPESRFKLDLGLTFYDVASGAWRKRRHRMLSPEQVLAREPHLQGKGLRGAGMYYDVLTDDARLTVETANGAAEAGAVVMNHAVVEALILENGTARGVVVRDLIDGEPVEVHARRVVNATGPWTDRTRALEHTRSTHALRPTKDVHIVLKKRDFPLNTAVFLRSPDDHRVVWPTPSLEDDVVYIGTTDTDYAGDLDDVHADERDIRYLLNVANRTIPDARLTESHVVGSWAGLRPLVAPPPGVSESNTSREHEITTGPTGMITISGGKLTSSRLMAKQVVDAAVAKTHARKSVAGSTPLPGADASSIAEARRSAEAEGVPADLAAVWIRRYGANAQRIIERWVRDPESRELIGDRLLTRAEIEYAVDAEMVVSLSDLLVRRTAVFFWSEDGGLASAEPIARELERLVPWPPGRREREIEEYRSLVLRNRPRG